MTRWSTLGALSDRRFPLRAYGAACVSAAVGQAHARPRAGVLRNPCYAGAYVHGIVCLPPSGRSPRHWSSGPAAPWPVLIVEHHEGYLGWADYLANEAALAANRPPREPPSP